MRPSGTRRALPLPTIFFSAPPEALEHPAHAGVAHRDTARPPQERAALGEGSHRALSLRGPSALQVALVDTGGLVMKAKVHPADLADREGARVLLERVGESFPDLEHLWADAGYRGADLRRWITERLGLSLAIVQRKPRWGCGFLTM